MELEFAYCCQLAYGQLIVIKFIFWTDRLFIYLSIYFFPAVPILADEPGLRLLSLQHNLIKRIQNLDSIFRLVNQTPYTYKGPCWARCFKTCMSVIYICLL
jgi:hypothetical protein